MNVSIHFEINGSGIDLNFPKEDFFKINRAGTIAAIVYTLEEKFRDADGGEYPIILFTARVTHDLQVEPIAAITCRDEAEAKRLVEIVEFKNRKTPGVGHISAVGYFNVGTLINPDWWREQVELFCFPEPIVDNGQRHGFALRDYRLYLDRPRELVAEELLPVTDWKTAFKLLRARQEKIIATKNREKDQFKNSPAPDEKLRESELLCLSKAYPNTITLLKNPQGKTPEEIFSAYQLETLANTGTLVGTLDKSNFQLAAKELANAARRKNAAFDAVGFELVAGWNLRGYKNMTPTERAAELKKLGLGEHAPETIRKKCDRLKLQSARERGKK